MRIDLPSSIPIFPLPSVVLFPTVSVPLYVFEPRYRELTRDALAHERRIGMVAVRPEHHHQLAGDPPVFAVGCEGSISHAEERPDGTWNVMLAATARFRIVEEPPRPESRLYRVVSIERLPESAVEPVAMHALRGAIRERLEVILERLTRAGATRPPLDRLDDLDDARFVDVLAQVLDFDVLEKQQLLESPGHLERAGTLRDLLDFRLAEGGLRAGTRSPRLH